jgi:hypothetical protein
MRMLPIVVALGLLVTTPVLAVGQSAKMDGREQNLTGPTLHTVQSAKMHAATESTNGNGKPHSVLHRRADN